jgi:hypothetical protein
MALSSRKWLRIATKEAGKAESGFGSPHSRTSPQAIPLSGFASLTGFCYIEFSSPDLGAGTKP